MMSFRSIPMPRRGAACAALVATVLIAACRPGNDRDPVNPPAPAPPSGPPLDPTVTTLEDGLRVGAGRNQF